MAKQKKEIRFTHLMTKEDLANLIKLARQMNRTPSDTLRELVREKLATSGTGKVLPAFIDLSPDTITKQVHEKVVKSIKEKS